MKDHRFYKGMAAGVVLTLAAGVIFNYSYDFFSDNLLADASFRSKLTTLERLIDQNYLHDTEDTDLEDGVYGGLITALGDKYSRYYTAEEYEQEQSSTDGSYVGIGISFMESESGDFEIVEVYEDSPAEEAGLCAGDILKTVNGTDVSGLETTDVVNMIRGKDGEEVTVGVLRGEKELEFTISITSVELKYVTGEMLDEKTGYISISQFTAVAPEQYEAVFEELEEAGMEKLIVDLRDNPGGVLTSVCDILRKILPEGLIVYTEDKNGNREEETCDGENALKIPMAVLVNGNSASASEIFAGAVKDYGIGTIVGTTTYGKGVVQGIYPLNDGSAVKLTISNYYTPKGTCIDGVGIEPDIEVELDESLKDQTEISHEEDNQLQTAVKALNE